MNFQLKIAIEWFNSGEKTNEELDNCGLYRFNIKNFTETYDYKLKNYYVFKVIDIDKESKTGYYGMCINKAFAKAVKEEFNNWKNGKK